MTDDEVQTALVRWLAQVTGVTVIKAHQGIDRPGLPYLTVEMSSVDELTQNPEQIHYTTLQTLNTEGLPEIEATPAIELEWVVFIFSFGESGSSALRKVKQAVHLKQSQMPLMPNLNIHETGVINSVPEFVDQAWEPRSQMNIMVRGVSSGGFVIDTIEDFETFVINRT